LSLIVSGMPYTRIDNPRPFRYWQLVVSIPEQKIKHGRRRARTWTVSADMGRPIAIDELCVNPEGIRAHFFERGVPVEPISVHIEVSYGGEKGNKVLAQAPLMPDQLWAHPVRIVERFDHLVAIDTNTKHGISVTGVVSGRAFKVQIPGKIAVVPPKLELCVEFRGMPDKAENIAWVQVIQAIRCSPTYRPHFQFGFIVDSDLGNLERYNNRELPVYGDFYLPQNMKFIYASSEIASETYTNMMIALADKESKRLRDYIIREGCDEGLRQAVNQPFTHFKQWGPSMLPARTN
jgi:hypothetical protein